MTLHEILQKASSKEDVKDVYIKALKLKNFQKNLIDIQTKEIWFEAKDTGKHSSYTMFTQLLHYVQDALNKGEEVPPFLCVIDTVKAAIMKTTDVIPFLQKKTIKWGKSASQYTPEALSEVSNFIGTYFVSFKIETHEAEFIETVKNAIASGDIIRTQITPDNLKQVFDKLIHLIGREISGIAESDYADAKLKKLTISELSNGILLLAMDEGRKQSKTKTKIECMSPLFRIGGKYNHNRVCDAILLS